MMQQLTYKAIYIAAVLWLSHHSIGRMVISEPLLLLARDAMWLLIVL
jgi:hypothetical protein